MVTKIFNTKMETEVDIEEEVEVDLEDMEEDKVLVDKETKEW